MSFLLREQMNPLLVVLVSILACLWFLSILGASNPYLTWNILIIICIYLLFRCLLLDMYSSLSSVVIMLFPLIYRMLIYIFLMLSIIILRCLLLDMYGSLSSVVTMLFPFDQQGAYLHIPIVKHHHCFLHFVWHNVPYQWKVLPFRLATAPRVFMALIKPILFFCHCKGFHIVIYLNDILVLVHSKQAGKRAYLFLCSLLVCLSLHINFFKSDLCLSQTFCFLGLCWDTVLMTVSLPPDKLAHIQWLALSLLQAQHVTVHRVMSFVR